MQKNNQYRYVYKIVLLLIAGVSLIGCTLVEPTEVPVVAMSWTVSREVFVFEDTNANGQYDSDEKPQPNVLVTSHSNIQGADERAVSRTDENGYATFEATFTHYFDIYVVPLCGYEPTTPTAWDASQPEQITVGLAPVQTREGNALFRVFLWFDEDRDGVEDEHELPVTYTSMQIILSEGDSRAEDIARDALSLTTGEDGWGEIDLGNSCSILTLWLPWSSQYWEITHAQPEPLSVGKNPNYVYSSWHTKFAYDLGETIIKIGLAPNSTGDVNSPPLYVARRDVMVFEDANANGSYDPGEKPLSNVPVYSWATHYYRERKLTYSGESGHVFIEALLSEEMYVKAVSPCGYVPTTPLMLTVDQPSGDTLYFGFEPEAPKDGEAVIQIHLWLDQNNNGQQEQDESPLSDEILHLYPFDDSGYGYDMLSIERDDAAALTDENGWVEFNLGNTCGTLEIDPTDITRWWDFGTVSNYEPEPVGFQSPDDMPNSRRIQFNYDIGVTVIEIGLTD